MIQSWDSEFARARDLVEDGQEINDPVKHGVRVGQSLARYLSTGMLITALFDVMLVRCRDGVFFGADQPLVKTAFILVGFADERNYHLRALIAVANIVQKQGFARCWPNWRSIVWTLCCPTRRLARRSTFAHSTISSANAV